MAADGACAAGRARAAHRRAHVLDRGRCRRTGPPRGVRTGAEATGLERRPQRAARHPLGLSRRYSHTRSGIGRARARRPRGCYWHRNHGVIARGDPHGADRAGFVASLARPGGNATGFTNYEYGMSGKWLELPKEIAPRVTRAAVLRDPAVASGIG